MFFHSNNKNIYSGNFSKSHANFNYKSLFRNAFIRIRFPNHKITILLTNVVRKQKHNKTHKTCLFFVSNNNDVLSVV